MKRVWFASALGVAAVIGLGAPNKIALAKTAKHHPAPDVSKPMIVKDCPDCPEMVVVPAGEF